MGYKKFMYTVFKLLVGADKAALLRNVTTQLMHLEYQFVIVRKDTAYLTTSFPGSYTKLSIPKSHAFMWWREIEMIFFARC